MFDKLKKDLTPCRTVKAQNLKSICKTTLFYKNCGLVCWTKTLILLRARINGVKAQMESFDYYFGVCVGELVLNHADILSKSLQSNYICS